jgi:hypothetical protein
LNSAFGAGINSSSSLGGVGSSIGELAYAVSSATDRAILPAGSSAGAVQTSVTESSSLALGLLAICALPLLAGLRNQPRCEHTIMMSA